MRTYTPHTLHTACVHAQAHSAGASSVGSAAGRMRPRRPAWDSCTVVRRRVLARAIAPRPPPGAGTSAVYHSAHYVGSVAHGSDE